MKLIIKMNLNLLTYEEKYLETQSRDQSCFSFSQTTYLNGWRKMDTQLYMQTIQSPETLSRKTIIQFNRTKQYCITNDKSVLWYLCYRIKQTSSPDTAIKLYLSTGTTPEKWLSSNNFNVFSSETALPPSGVSSYRSQLDNWNKMEIIKSELAFCKFLL